MTNRLKSRTRPPFHSSPQEARASSLTYTPIFSCDWSASSGVCSRNDKACTYFVYSARSRFLMSAVRHSLSSISSFATSQGRQASAVTPFRAIGYSQGIVCLSYKSFCVHAVKSYEMAFLRFLWVPGRSSGNLALLILGASRSFLSYSTPADYNHRTASKLPSIPSYLYSFDSASTRPGRPACGIRWDASAS